MHDQIFCQSFQPPLTRVLGLPLHNYTIGHEIALIRQGNPLVTYSEKSFAELPADARRLALVMAVDVCCQRNRFSKWILGWKSYRAGIEAELAKFREYLNAGSQDVPTTRMPRTHGVPFHYFGGPELARLLNYVATAHWKLIDAHFGGSPLNFPFGLAKMLYSAHLESEGHIWIKNDRDMDLDRKAAEPRPPGAPAEEVLIGAAAEAKWEEITGSKKTKGN